MENNRLIAEALLEIAKKSTTEFIEVGQDYELIEAAEKFNIKLPSPDLAVIKTVYAEIDKPNLNGIILPKEAVEKGLPTLVGKQINWEHQGRGRICGYIIDAKINKDQIEITGVIFKSLFPEEMEEVKQKFEKKELCVSFEIWNRNPVNRESVVHELANGFHSLDPIIFHGCGLLLANPPACPKAKVYKLVAKVLTEAEKIVEKVFDEDLIFATSAIEEPKCKNCNTCTCEKDKEVQKVEDIKLEEILENDYEGGEIEEAKKLTTEQRNALPDDDFALIQKKDGKKIRRFPINDEAHVRNALARLPQAKDITEEEKKSVLAKILKKAKELNMDELLKKYEKAEEKPSEEAKERLCPECKEPMKDDETDLCAKCLKKKEMQKSSEETQAEVKPEETKTEEKSEVAETKSEEIKAEETKEEVIVEKKEEAQAEQVVEPKKVISIIREETVITTDTDGKCERKGNRKVTTKYNDGTEDINTEDYQVVDTYTQAQLEEKVNTLKAEHEKVLAEKDIEIKNKTEELGKKDQEIEELKNPKVDAKKEKEMTVGTVEVKEKNKEIQKGIDDRAFGKR